MFAFKFSAVLGIFMMVVTATLSQQSTNNQGLYDHIDEIFAEKLYKESLRNPDNSQQRKLQTTRECGEIYGIVTAEEIRAFGNIYVNVLLPPGFESFATTAAQILLGLVKYDIQVAKSCMTCEGVKAMLSDDQLMSDHEYGFMTYCGEDVYGSDSVQSALIFTPLDPESGEPLSGNLRGFLNGRGTVLRLADTATEVFPLPLSEYLATAEISDILFLMTDYLAPLVASGAGLVSITPDPIGYGESYEYDRTYLTPVFYAQSHALSWMGAKKFITNVTDGCTLLEDAVTVYGFSEGGYASVPGSFAVEQCGAQIQQLHISAGPLYPEFQFSYGFEFLAENEPLDGEVGDTYNAIVPIITYALSKEHPGLANTGFDQPMANREWLSPVAFERNLIAWFDSPATLGYGYLGLTPQNISDLYNPNLVDMYIDALADGVRLPCANGYATPNVTDKLCQLIDEANVLDDLERLATFPTIMCYSADDKLVSSIANQPDYETFSNPNVMAYVPITNLLAPQGSHNTVQVLCALSPIQALSVPGVVSITPLQNPPAHCPRDPTMFPSEAPSIPPSPSPSVMPVASPPSMMPVVANPTEMPVAAPTSGVVAFSLFSSLVSLVAVLMILV